MLSERKNKSKSSSISPLKFSPTVTKHKAEMITSAGKGNRKNWIKSSKKEQYRSRSSASENKDEIKNRLSKEQRIRMRSHDGSSIYQALLDADTNHRRKSTCNFN